MLPQSEATSSTPKSVVAGLGYPNGRVELSAEPTGWQSDSNEATVNVSRETIG